MAHAFGHDETLPRGNIDNAIFEIDQEMSVENKKEFIDVSVFVPVIFALNHGQPDDSIVYLAKRLIVPLVGARLYKRWDVDNIERVEFDVEMHGIREGGGIRCRHRFLLLERNKEAEKCYRRSLRHGQHSSNRMYRRQAD